MKSMYNNGTRYCPICGQKLVKNGHYANGKIRLYCKKCKKSFLPNKAAMKALEKYHWQNKYEKYLSSKTSIKDLNIPKSTFWRHTHKFSYENLVLYPAPSKVKCIALDGTWTGNACYLIAAGVIDGCKEQIPLGYMKTTIEKTSTWMELISKLPECEYFICDAQKGLLKAIKQLRPNAKIQICIYHIWKTIRTKLSLHPETEAGKDLLAISRFLLSKVKEGAKFNKEQSIKENQTEMEEQISQVKQDDISLADRIELFKEWLKYWDEKYKDFINHKTICEGSKHWFYTHRNVRSAYRTLKRHLDNDYLFQFSTASGVPRTNNGIEGGINSQIKRLIWAHRGSSFNTRNSIIMIYLKSRSIKSQLIWRK